MAGCGPSTSSKDVVTSNINSNSNSNSESGINTISGDYVNLEIHLFAPSDLNSIVSNIEEHMNAYQFQLEKIDENCADEVNYDIINSLISNTKLDLIVSKNCSYLASLAYGNSSDFLSDEVLKAAKIETPEGNNLTEIETKDKDSNKLHLMAESHSLSLVGYEGEGGVKEYIDKKCVNCHQASENKSNARADLSNYESVRASIGPILTYMSGNQDSYMPPSGIDPDGLLLIKKWVHSGYENKANISNKTLSKVFYKSNTDIEIDLSTLESNSKIILKFLLGVTKEGLELGLTSTTVKVIQGTSYERGKGIQTPDGLENIQTVSTTDTNEDTETNEDTDKTMSQNTDTNSTTVPSYQNDIVPILNKGGCTSANCHAQGRIYPDLSTHEFVVNSYERVYQRSQLKTMPPDSSSFPKLSDEDLAVLRSWYEGGYPNN